MVVFHNGLGNGQSCFFKPFFTDLLFHVKELVIINYLVPAFMLILVIVAIIFIIIEVIIPVNAAFIGKYFTEPVYSDVCVETSFQENGAVKDHFLFFS